MKTNPTPPQTIDEYIAGFPPAVQATLAKIRTTIKEAAPEAQETLKYKIPTFTLKGNLVSFAAYKNHIGLYPVPTGTQAFNKALSVYRAAKATVRFPLDQPIPFDLISQLVKFRVKDQLKRAETNKKKK